MRKLKLQMQMSIDGFVGGPNGEMDWLTFGWDEEVGKFINDLMASVDMILLGRKLAEGFIPTWTARLADAPEDESARWMVETPKIVFSNTLQNIEWAHTELAQGDAAQEITRLKEQSGGDMIAYGGGSFVSFLIKNNLIDEYNLFINPVALGKGLAIFNELQERLNLQLVEGKVFSCGITALKLTPKNQDL